MSTCREGRRFQELVTREVVRRWPGTLVEPVFWPAIPDLVIPEIGVVVEVKRTLRRPAVEQVMRYRRVCAREFKRPFRGVLVARWAAWMPEVAEVLVDFEDFHKDFKLGVLVLGRTV